MSHITPRERAALEFVAQGIRDAFEEDGYTVDLALDQHDDYRRTRVPASGLERALATGAAERGAREAGLYFSNGSRLTLFTESDTVSRRFRVKKIDIDAEGRYRAMCGLGSSLLVDEPEGLLPQESWVLGYHVSEDRVVDHVVAAQIVDWEQRGNGPVQLLFGTVIELLGEQPPRRFVSSDEGLEGFGEGEIGDGSGLAF